jgi:hypothetical protein
MLYNAERGNITMGFVGDAMTTRKMRPFTEPDFVKLIELIQSTDASFANLEQIYHHYEMSWQNKEHYSYQASDPSVLEEVKWMGFDAVTTATNHAYDYSEAGFLKTLEHCDAYGIPHCGGGVNIGEARAPVFVDTDAGRVALMSGTTTFSEESRAGEGRPDFPGKPGVNAIRHDTVYYVPKETFDAIKQANEGLGFNAAQQNRKKFQPQTVRDQGDENEIKLFGNTIRLGDEFKVETSVNQQDMTGCGDWIRGARKQSDWVVYGLHMHESANYGDFQGNSRIPPADFHVEFCHYAVDKGCDVISGHGSHFLRGIEIYNGKPIFYSLGNFIYQNETIRRVPPPGYSLQGLGHEQTPGDWGDARSGGGKYGSAANPIIYRSVFAVTEFEDWNLKEVRLYPVELGQGKVLSQRGRPMLVHGDLANEILTWIQNVSEPFGTEVTIEGDVGYIRP